MKSNVYIKKIVNSIPVPMTGLMLALAAAGNLVSSYGNIFKSIFGILSCIILVLLVMKITCDNKAVMEDLKNPAIAGIASTFPMGIMVLSTYIRSFLPVVAYGLWIIGILTHCVLIIYFTKKFILDFNIQKIFPSCFVVYVGIAAGSLMAPMYNAAEIGKVLFWFGFIAYLVLSKLLGFYISFCNKCDSDKECRPFFYKDAHGRSGIHIFRALRRIISCCICFLCFDQIYWLHIPTVCQHGAATECCKAVK